MRKTIALLAVAAAVFFSGEAAAAGCGGRAGDPMTSTADFGVGRCKVWQPRYDSRAFTRVGARRTSSDPMVWSDARWRSSLFAGYARSYASRYDLRFRRSETRRLVRVEAEIVIDNEPEPSAAPASAPRRAKMINLRDGTVDVMENRVGFAGHKCPGVLVLTWGAAGSRARCFNEQGRIRRPL